MMVDIKKLKEQSMVTNNRGDGYYDRVFDETLFAKLIVNECKQAIFDNIPDVRSSNERSNGYITGMTDCLKHINARFGFLDYMDI